MNLSPLLFCILTCLTGRGSSEEPQSFWNWRTLCMECGNPVECPRDLFCGNFGACRGTLQVCRRAWHGRCYTASLTTTFKIALPENDEGAAWRKERQEDRFVRARNGDMLCVPFQCDYCWFFTLKRRHVNAASPSDRLLLAYIRQVNLDMMWSREESTVRDTLTQVKKGRSLSGELGLSPVPLEVGPWPDTDWMGLQVAVELLRASQKQGRNDNSYVQFDSIRKIRSSYATMLQTSPLGLQNNLLMKGPRGRSFGLTSSITDSIGFRMFMTGCEKRMGRLVIQELGFTVEVVMEMLSGWDVMLNSEEIAVGRKRDIVIVGATLVVLVGGALRGGEVLLMEASELVKR